MSILLLCTVLDHYHHSLAFPGYFSDRLVGGRTGLQYAHVKQAGVRGTGFWTADATQLNETVIDKMWGAVL